MNVMLGNILAVVHRDGGQYEAFHGTQKATEDAIVHIGKMREAMEEFCMRVESGEVRSSYTYNKFKNLLELK